MDMENVIMQLIVDGGDARSMALEAVAAAGRKDFETAEQKLKECNESLLKAHHVQTDLIQGEIRGENTKISLLLVHGQDHLMNAITVKDLAEQMVEMYRVMYGIK